jgi:predicted nucleic acid-binding Zn ribbon protein
MRKYLVRIKPKNICKVCGMEFEGLSKYYCSIQCANVDDLPKKLEKAWQNNQGHTKQLS